MSKQKKSPSWKRWIKLKYTQLMRAPGGAAFVALGFSIGMAIEMFTLPTYGLAFFLIFPLIYWMGGSLAGALIGFVVGKIIFIPVAFINNRVGGWVLPNNMKIHVPFGPDWFAERLDHILLVNLKLIVGGIIDGVILGFIFYFPVKYCIQAVANRRKEKRKLRRVHLETSAARLPATE